jgi:hypothetical protein
VTKPLDVLNDKALQVRRVNAKHQKHKTWPIEKRIEVVTKYLALGNMSLVAELTGVGHQLCRLWKTQPWWKEMEAEIRAARTSQVDSKLSKIIDKSLEMIEDRLENGTVEVAKDGSIFRRPANIKEITNVSQVLMGQQLQMQKAQKEELVQQEQISVKDQLAMLAAEFAKFNTKRTVDVVSKEISSAIHEEREEGLQEGSSTLYLETGGSEEEDDAECSEEGSGETRFSPQG